MRAARAPISVLFARRDGVGSRSWRAPFMRSRRGPRVPSMASTARPGRAPLRWRASCSAARRGVHRLRGDAARAVRGGQRRNGLPRRGRRSAARDAGQALRVLEERVVTRLGSTRARLIDARFLVAATNRDVEGRAEPGVFRSTSTSAWRAFRWRSRRFASAPPRSPFWVKTFVAAACKAPRSRALGGVAELLPPRPGDYSWPGNVRELRNVIDRAAVLCAGRHSILPEHLSPSARFRRPSPPPSWLATVSSAGSTGRRSLSPDHGGQGLQDEIKSLERARITTALERSGGKQSKAAEALGISALHPGLSSVRVRPPRPRKSS